MASLGDEIEDLKLGRPPSAAPRVVPFALCGPPSDDAHTALISSMAPNDPAVCLVAAFEENGRRRVDFSTCAIRRTPLAEVLHLSRCQHGFRNSWLCEH